MILLLYFDYFCLVVSVNYLKTFNHFFFEKEMAFVFIISMIIGCVLSQELCVWELGDNILDLQVFSAEIFSYNDSINVYRYTPCQNGLECVDMPGMATKSDIQDNCESLLGVYETSVYPEYNQDTETWFFNYSNGDTCPTNNNEETVFQSVFKCDRNIDPYVIDGVMVISEEKCIYQMTISTIYACIEDDGSLLSAGDILLLVGFILFSLYCLIGFIIKCVRYKFILKRNKKCYDYVPNQEFWLTLPKWVSYSYIIVIIC